MAQARLIALPAIPGRGIMPVPSQARLPMPHPLRCNPATLAFALAMLAIRPAAGQAINEPADWQGVWRGHYVCTQGVTALTLTIKRDEENRLTASFAFHAHPGNPNIPSGEFGMTGKPGPTPRHLALHARSWIKQPASYVTVGLDGDYDPATGYFRGTVDGPGCSTFLLQRDLIS